MTLKKIVAMGIMAIVLASSAAPGMAMDRFDRIWLRDTLVGGGAGLVVGVTSRNSGGWLIVGLILGGVFGYLDAKDNLIGDAGSTAPWAPAPLIAVETRAIDGREQPEQVLKATLYQVRW